MALRRVVDLPCDADKQDMPRRSERRLSGGLVISPSVPVHNFWQRSARAFCRAAEPVVRAFASEGHAA